MRNEPSNVCQRKISVKRRLSTVLAGKCIFLFEAAWAELSENKVSFEASLLRTFRDKGGFKVVAEAIRFALPDIGGIFPDSEVRDSTSECLAWMRTDNSTADSRNTRESGGRDPEKKKKSLLKEAFSFFTL